MDDYIKREAALDSLCTACECVPIEDKEICPFRFTGCQEYANISSLPAADVRPVVRSAWEQVEVMHLEDMQAPPDTIASMYCPNCKRYTNRVYFYGDPTEFVNYCCYCGADMR